MEPPYLARRFSCSAWDTKPKVRATHNGYVLWEMSLLETLFGWCERKGIKAESQISLNSVSIRVTHIDERPHQRPSVSWAIS